MCVAKPADLHAIITIINTLVLIHAFVLESMQAEAINYLLVCIPVVIFGAPLGAFTINKVGRKPIASILIAIIIIQFLFALLIINPGFTLLIFSFGIFMTVVILFFILASNHQAR